MEIIPEKLQPHMTDDPYNPGKFIDTLLVAHDVFFIPHGSIRHAIKCSFVKDVRERKNSAGMKERSPRSFDHQFSQK